MSVVPGRWGFGEFQGKFGREGGRASSVEDAFQNSPEWWGQQVLYVPWDKEADTDLG